jgi:hypothetical protein
VLEADEARTLIDAIDTTSLYDRRDDEISLDEVKRIGI